MKKINEILKLSTDFSKKGKCKNCIACCTPDVLITKEEYLLLKSKLSPEVVSNIRETLDKRINLYCPFVDLKNKKCKVYNERPFACRIYHCNQKRIKKNIISNAENMKNLKLEYSILDILPLDIKKVYIECLEIVRKEENKRGK